MRGKKIEYIEINGLLYPNLKLSDKNDILLSKFGRMKCKYLKEHRPILFTNLLISGELNDYLEKFDREMNKIYEQLIEQYKIKWNVTEELKENNQMKWVQEMNNIEMAVLEFIRDIYIYE